MKKRKFDHEILCCRAAEHLGVRLQMVLDKGGLKLREGFSSHINHSCLSGKFQKAILLPS